MKRLQQQNSEHGNVLFYILIAIALLAALSFAVAQSSRGNIQQLSAEKGRLLATEILEYANTYSSAVSQLRLRGVKDSELCFDDPQWGVANYNHAGCGDSINKIYSTDGAGLIWSKPPVEAMDTSLTPDDLWHIYGDNAVEGVGTTCTDASCADLLLVADELSQVVCAQINILLEISEEGDPIPSDNGLGETRYIGVYGHNHTISHADIDGKTAACFEKTGSPSEYVFYKVLIAR